MDVIDKISNNYKKIQNIIDNCLGDTIYKLPTDMGDGMKCYHAGTSIGKKCMVCGRIVQRNYDL